MHLFKVLGRAACRASVYLTLTATAVAKHTPHWSSIDKNLPRIQERVMLDCGYCSKKLHCNCSKHSVYKKDISMKGIESWLSLGP